MELCHGVSLGLVHLLTKSSQLRWQVGLRFLRLFTLTGLLRKRSKLGRQLFVKGTDDLLILISFFVLYLLTLVEPLDHLLIGHTPILKGFHSLQCLKKKKNG